MRMAIITCLLCLGAALPAAAQQGHWKKLPNACESGIPPAVLTDHGVDAKKTSCPLETARSYPRDLPPATGDQQNRSGHRA